MEQKVRPVRSDGWVIINLSHKKSSTTGLYNSLVPYECVRILGGMEQTRKAIAYAGGWNQEDITIRTGSKEIWGHQADKVIIVERKG